MTSPHKTGFWRWLKGLMLKHMHHMITCVEFENFVLSYLEGELSAKQRSVFEWHLRLCAECREYLAAYQRSLEIGEQNFAKVKSALGRIFETDLPALRKAMDEAGVPWTPGRGVPGRN